jgi:uncharacterized protein YpiB (UPF0302 family)
LSLGGYVSITYEYKETKADKIYIYKRLHFENLYENTDYIAYFIGENDLPINPDIMSTS